MSKILLIEDDATLLQEVTEWLTFEGYTVTGASTGTDGVRMALQEVPDLIVSDIMLPGIDGYRVLLELRKHHQTALIPFIFTSALSEHQNIRFGMELGADDYITKPFSSVELLGAVQSRLEKQKLAQQKLKSDLDSLRTSVIRFLPHELRTPLVGIMGAAELMTMDADVITPSEIIEMAEVIAHSGRRLLRLVENFSIYSELELKNTISTNSIVSHPEMIIEKICQNLRVEYKRAGDINWTCRREALAIPEDHFKKIVYELVDNAFKFSGAGSLIGGVPT